MVTTLRNSVWYPYLKYVSNNIRKSTNITLFNKLVKTWEGHRCQYTMYMKKIDTQLGNNENI